MNKQTQRLLAAGCGLLLAFALLTAALLHVDVRPIGPNGSPVGLAAVNGAVHQLLGVHLRLYVLTDWLSLAALPIMLGFALLGLVQLIRRRSLLRVDGDILALGVFYLAVLGAYLFFEFHVVNYRPVLLSGVLEASYPSSTTMLMLCVMVTAMLQFHRRIQTPVRRRAVNLLCGLFAAAMILGRLVSGVHWLTDIVGGGLLSDGLILLYAAALSFWDGKRGTDAAHSPEVNP